MLSTVLGLSYEEITCRTEVSSSLFILPCVECWRN